MADRDLCVYKPKKPRNTYKPKAIQVFDAWPGEADRSLPRMYHELSESVNQQAYPL